MRLVQRFPWLFRVRFGFPRSKLILSLSCWAAPGFEPATPACKLCSSPGHSSNSGQLALSLVASTRHSTQSGLCSSARVENRLCGSDVSESVVSIRMKVQTALLRNWLLLKGHRRAANSLPLEGDSHLDAVSDFDEGNAAVHPIVLAVEGHRPFNRAGPGAAT